MKKIALIFGLAVMTLIACTKDPDPCDGIKYSTHIKSILNKSCNVEPCHAAGTNNTDYTDWKNINAGAFTKRVFTDKDMPKPDAVSSGLVPALTDKQKADLKCWLDAGALNN